MRLLVMAVVAPLLLLLGPAPTQALEGEMGQARAGRVFLDAVCPGDAAETRFSRRVFRGRDEIKYTEVRRRLPEIRRESARLATATYREARQLKNPPRGWPADVDGAVDRYIAAALEFHFWMDAASEATNARGWGGKFANAGDAFRGTKRPEVQIRATLNLPPRGRGC